MGSIFFVADLEQSTLIAIKNAHDCADIANDLARIQSTIQYGTDGEARALDREMTQKYPAIYAMLQFANSLPVRPAQRTTGTRNESVDKKNLRADYWGILCDTAIKKNIKKSFEECIDYVTE